MKHKKRVWIGLTAGLAVLILAAVLIRPMLRRTPRVTLVMKTAVTTAEFWEVTMEGVEQAAADFQVDLTVTGTQAEKEIDEQIAIMDQVIEDQPDVIILAASDYNAMAESAEKAVAAGIKLLTMDSDVNTDVQSCYIASDNVEIGRAMGRLMVQRLPEGGEIGILIHGNSSSAGDRVRGTLEVLEQTGGFTVVGTYDCNDERNRARIFTAQLLQEHPDLAGIVCVNEVCNTGAADYIAAYAADRNIQLIGCDSSKTQVRYLEQGIIQGIVIQQPFNMGYLAVKSAAALAAGEKLDRQVVIPCVTITKENMNDLENQKLLFPFLGTE